MYRRTTMPILIPPSTISGQLQYHWLDPRGTLRNLNREGSPNIFIPRGSVGLGAPEFDLVSDKYPFFAGSYLRHINTNPRDIQIPIFVRSDSLGGLALSVEDLYSWFDTGDETNRTPGYLRVTRPDGSVRQIALYFKGGFLGDTEEGAPTWTQYILEMFAPDPYPTGPDVITSVYPQAVSGSFSVGLMNVGKLPAYPIITAHGLFTSINVQNATTNGIVGFFAATSATRELIIDMRPDELRQGLAVYDDLGVNKISTISISPGAETFWHLAPGVNDLTILFSGATSPETLVTIDYLPRYRSLLR